MYRFALQRYGKKDSKPKEKGEKISPYTFMR